MSYGKRFFLFLLVVLVCVGSCTQQNKSQVSVQDIQNYFPMQVGARWTYEIVPGEAMPYICQILYWPLGNGEAIVQTNKSLLLPLVLQRTQREAFLLRLRIAEAVEKIPLFTMPTKRIVRLEIEIDELGLYKMYKEVYWMMEEGGTVSEICYLPAQGVFGVSHPVSGCIEDGYTAKPLIYPGGIKQHLAFGNREHFLQYIGLDSGRLRFARLLKIEASPEEDALENFAGTEFLENYFYAKGKGRDLISLNIDGKLAMVWRLTNFEIE